MEYIEGRELYDLAVKGLPEDKIFKYITQILTGLKGIHDRDWVHRDIKLGNIMVESESDVCYILDLGFAVNINNPFEYEETAGHSYETCERELERTASRKFQYTCKYPKGSLMYGAPELLDEGWRAMENDCRPADIYSLGVTIYEMMCRQGLFKDRGDGGFDCRHINYNNLLMKSHMTLENDGEKWSTTSCLGGEKNEFLKNLVNKMLTLEPKDRPTAGNCLLWIENPALLEEIVKQEKEEKERRELEEKKISDAEERKRKEVLNMYLELNHPKFNFGLTINDINIYKHSLTSGVLGSFDNWRERSEGMKEIINKYKYYIQLIYNISGGGEANRLKLQLMSQLKGFFTTHKISDIMDITPKRRRNFAGEHEFTDKLMILDTLYKMITTPVVGIGQKKHDKIITTITMNYPTIQPPLYVGVRDGTDIIINRYLDYLICLENFFYDKSGWWYRWSSKLEGMKGLPDREIAKGGGVDKLFSALKQQIKIYPGPESRSRGLCSSSGCAVGQVPATPVVQRERRIKQERLFRIENIVGEEGNSEQLKMMINEDGTVTNGIKFNGKVLSPHVFMSYFAAELVQGGGNLKTKRKYKRRNTKRKHYRNTKRNTKRRNTKRKNTKRRNTKRRNTKRRNTKRR